MSRNDRSKFAARKKHFVPFINKNNRIQYDSRMSLNANFSLIS